jgi:hypothetical protein
MKKSANAKMVPVPARESSLPAGLIFEVDRRQLRTLIGRREVRRRALADSHRRTLERLIKKSGTVDINEYTRERLERSIRVNEDLAEFLSFAGDHLVGSRGKRSLTPSDLATLDLMPRYSPD